MAKLVAQARAAQVRGKYNPDAWVVVPLKAMTKLWTGMNEENTPKPSLYGKHEKEKGTFFFGEEDARDARGAYVGDVPHRFAQTLWRWLQVREHRTHGFRLGIREFVVDLDTKVAMSVCLANSRFGRGSLVQYYLHDGWNHFLHPTGREHRFPAAGYR